MDSKQEMVLVDDSGEVVDGPTEMALEDALLLNKERHAKRQMFRWVMYSRSLHVIPDFVSED
jgi:hypothetical protein